MQDIDFDELDRAVQGMMAGDAAMPASVEDNPFISDAPATPAPTSTPQPAPTPQPTPTPAPTQAPTKPPVVTTPAPTQAPATKPPVTPAPAPTQPPRASAAPATSAPVPTPAAVVATPPPATKKPEAPHQTPAIWPPVTPAPLPTWAPVVTAAPRSRPTPQPSQAPVTTPTPAVPASQTRTVSPAAPAKTSGPLAAPVSVAVVTPAPTPTPTPAPTPEIHTRAGGGLQHQLTSTRRQGGVESKRVLPVHKVIKLESPMPPQSPELPADATAATAVPATSLTALVTPAPTPTPQPITTPAPTSQPTPTPAVSSVFGNYDTLAPHGKLTIRTPESSTEPPVQPTPTPQPTTPPPTAIAVTTLPATKAPEPTTPPTKPASKAQATAIAVTSKAHAVPVTPAAATKAAPPAKRARKRVSVVAAGATAGAAAATAASHTASSAAQASSMPVATQAVRRQRSGGRFMDMVQAAPAPAKTLGPSARAQARRRRAVPAEIVPTPPMPPSLESPAPAAADDHVMAEIETAVVQATHRPEHSDLFDSAEGDTSFVHHATNDELAGTTDDYTDHTYAVADDDAAYDNIVNSYHATPAPQTDEPDGHEPYSTAADEYDDQASGSHEPDDMFAQVDPIEPAEETGAAMHSEQHYYGLTDDERAALEQRRSAVFQEGPQAIDQQYQESVAPEADGHAVSDIYDTQRYHTPLGDTPHKKRRDPWAWVTAGLLLIMLGSICFILWYAGIMAF